MLDTSLPLPRAISSACNLLKTMPDSDSLNWIDSQQSRMLALVEHWASLNSGTYHAAGVERFAQALLPEFSTFDATPELLPVPPVEEVGPRGELLRRPLGPALSLRCRPEAARQVLLAIHLDTVYPADSDFQAVHRQGAKLHGPGVADAKGGIAVLLVALQALERFVEQSGQTSLGWEVLLNPDEEIGSPGSNTFLHRAALRNHVGLLFEPALPDGEFAGARKGSANFHIVCRGKSAHAGRHFDEGINATVAASQLGVWLHQLNGHWPGATLNIARIDGGGPLNMVPEVAVLRLNVRYSQPEHELEIAEEFQKLFHQIELDCGVTVERYGTFNTPPKPFSGLTHNLFEQIRESAQKQGITLNHRETGGVCDGNRLAGWELPNLDNLGVRGGDIHSRHEHLLIDSLAERARLTAALLIGWASGEFRWLYERPSASTT